MISRRPSAPQGTDAGPVRPPAMRIEETTDSIIHLIGVGVGERMQKDQCRRRIGLPRTSEDIETAA